MGAKIISQAGDLESAPLLRELHPPRRILVVDAEPDSRQLAAEILIHSGYEVDAVTDGNIAWEALDDESGYDLLITDNNNPKLTGIELLKKLRAARMVLPVIMATGTLPAQEFAGRPWLRPAATLLKPYDIGLLLETVKKVLCEADSAAAGSPFFLEHDLAENKILPAAPNRLCLADSPRRILVVDENRDLRLLYIEALARPGWFIDVAEDGAAAWEALQTNDYNLLITDNEIPEMNGVELVRKLRSARLALPIIMAAEKLPVYELVRNPSLQLAATLLKPFALDALLNTVKEVLRAADSLREQIASPSESPSPSSAIALWP